jgi:type VI secretion system protein ImpM
VPVAVGGSTSGFYGKLPSRGDFVRGGLPRGFIDPWDEWLQAGIAASRRDLGDNWLAAWMEAPVWRFALPAGLCGQMPVLGLWMPSVDRAGRHFPLTLAVQVPGATADMLAAEGTAWLEEAEQAGLDALEHLSTPDELARRIGAAAPPAPAPAVEAGHSLWWSAGSPFVSASRLQILGLPAASQFATMIRNCDGRTLQSGQMEAS